MTSLDKKIVLNGTLEDLIAQTAELVRPPRRINVPDAATKYRFMRSPTYTGPWSHDETPYLYEPMSLLTDRRYRTVCFVGPAQAGKTEMFLNWLLWHILCAPDNIIIFQTNQAMAKDFSQRRVDKMNRDTPAVREMMRAALGSDNIYTKIYKGGTMVNFAHPTKNQLRGRPLGRIGITDYDGMDSDVGGEGDLYSLALQRMNSYEEYAKLLIESSVGKDVLNTGWSPEHDHDVPPMEGINSIYRQGDMRHWYWQCFNCGLWFSPKLELLHWTEKKDPRAMAETVYLECKHCQAKYLDTGADHIKTDMPPKYEMNKKGVWLPAGCTLDIDGKIEGTPRKTDIASFALNGVAARFKTWANLLAEKFEAEEHFNGTGREEKLKSFYNAAVGIHYTPKAAEGQRTAAELMGRAEDIGLKVVPVGVRFLVASVDVQKHYFDVQITGVGLGGDLYVIDRFRLKESHRPDTDPKTENKWLGLRPFRYAADWRVLYEWVMKAEYRMAEDNNRLMSVLTTICDSGGLSKGAQPAYDFYRFVQNGPSESDKDYEEWNNKWSADYVRRFWLFKGADTASNKDTRTSIDWPDAESKKRGSIHRQNVPLLNTRTNLIKDQLNNILDRRIKGEGMVHFPAWLKIDYYSELVAEVRDARGKWAKVKSNQNNETMDLFVMLLAVLTNQKLINIENLDWATPPAFALPQTENPFVRSEIENKGLDKPAKKELSFAELARETGGG